jgi:signal transduction histidine kinase
VTVRWFLDGDMVVTQVQDTGIGIAREEQDRIFERFYRVDKARSRALGGTGLGLSIVKHMTQSLGGTVTVRSEPDVGSTFEIRLPMGIEVAGPVEKTR